MDGLSLSDQRINIILTSSLTDLRLKTATKYIDISRPEFHVSVPLRIATTFKLVPRRLKVESSLLEASFGLGMNVLAYNCADGGIEFCVILLKS